MASTAPQVELDREKESSALHAELRKLLTEWAEKRKDEIEREATNNARSAA